MDFTLSDVLLPVVNSLLGAGLPLPNAPGLALTQAQVEYKEGYILLQSNFTFNPPIPGEGMHRVRIGDEVLSTEEAYA